MISDSRFAKDCYPVATAPGTDLTQIETLPSRVVYLIERLFPSGSMTPCAKLSSSVSGKPPKPREIPAAIILAPPFGSLIEEKVGRLSNVRFQGVFAHEIAEKKVSKAILLTYKPISLIYVRLLLTYSVAL
jgi:hypothetical protein